MDSSLPATNSPLRERPTRDDIAALPPFDALTLDRIELPESPAALEAARRAIVAAGLVGFDTESKPTFTRDAVNDGPHVVQFALADRAYVVQVATPGVLAFVKDVLESTAIVKVGSGLSSDRGLLMRRFGIALAATVDLTDTMRALRYRQAVGVKAAVAIVLGRRFSKSKRVTTSNWGAPHLQASQLIYAANDAYAALKVYEALGCPGLEAARS